MKLYTWFGDFLDHKTTKNIIDIFFRTKGFYATLLIIILMISSSCNLPILYDILIALSQIIDNTIAKRIVETIANAFLGYNYLMLVVGIILLVIVCYFRYLELKISKSVEKGIFDQVQKSLDNLRLEEANGYLIIIYNEYSNLNDIQRHEFHKLKGTYNLLAGKYLPENNGLDTFGYEYIKAGDAFSGTDEAKRILALGYLHTHRIDESKIILEELIKASNSDKVFSTYIYLKYEIDKNLDQIILLVDANDKFKNSKTIYKTLGRLAFQEQQYSKAKEFYQKGVSDNDSMDDKIAYFMIFTDYCGELNGFNNISKSHRDELISFNNFLDQLVPKVEGKNLNGIEDGIYNIKAIIAGSIFHEYDNASFYYRKIINNNSNKLNGVTKMNLVVFLMNSGKESLIQDAKPILEDIIDRFSEYLAELINNPNRHVLFQAYFLYFSNFIPENKGKGYSELLAFKTKYAKDLDKPNKRNLNAVILLTYAREEDKKKLINEFLREDDSVWNNILAFKVTEDRAYLNHAFELYTQGDNLDTNANLHLGKSLVNIGDKDKAYSLIKDNLEDFSQGLYVELLFGLGIELGKKKEVSKIIDSYEEYNGGKSTPFSELLRSKFLELTGDQAGALAIVSSSKYLNGDIKLLFRKGHLEFQLGMSGKFQETLSEIRKVSINGLDEESILKYLEFVYQQDKDWVFYEAYRLAQDVKISDAFRHELLTILFKVHLDVTINPIEQELIDEDSFVTVEDLDNLTQKGIVFDGFSRNLGADYVIDGNNSIYKYLIGKKRGDIIDNLFGTPLGIPTKHKVVSITNKYVVQIRHIFGNIEQFGGRMFHFDESNPADSLSKMLDLSQSGNESREKIMDELHSQSLLSFYSISKNLQNSYIEDYFRICEGEKFNFVLDVESFGINQFSFNGVLLDITSIITIFRLGLENNLARLNQQLFISQFTLNYFISEIQVKGLNKNNYINLEDNYVLVSDFADNIQKWLVANCIVINTESYIINPKGELEDFFGIPSYHSLLLAKERNLILISDDIALRRFARNEDFQVISGGLILLIKLLYAKEILSIEDFSIIGDKLRELHFIAPLDKV